MKKIINRKNNQIEAQRHAELIEALNCIAGELRAFSIYVQDCRGFNVNCQGFNATDLNEIISRLNNGKSISR